VATSGFTVDANDVTGSNGSVERRGDGVVVLPSTFGSARGATRLGSNRVRDVGGRGVAVLAQVTSLEITHNLVERALDGIVMAERARAQSVVVSDNTVTDVGSRETDKVEGVSGIQVVGCYRASVESNTVHGVAASDSVGGRSVGIRVLGCVDSQVVGNSVDRVGPATRGGLDLGIAVQGRILRTRVAGNTSRRQPVDVDEDGPSGFRGLLIGGQITPEQATATVANGYVAGDGPATFVVGRMAAYAVAFRPATVTVDTNIVSGSGEISAALVSVAGEVVATGNHIHNRLRSGSSALQLVADAASVSSNRLRGGEPSGELDVNPEKLAVLGNLTTTGIAVFGGGLDPRWAPLNLSGV
jgi:hypothetical protein